MSKPHIRKQGKYMSIWHSRGASNQPPTLQLRTDKFSTAVWYYNHYFSNPCNS